MKRLTPLFHSRSTRYIGLFICIVFLGIIRWLFDRSVLDHGSVSILPLDGNQLYYRRQSCSCSRPILTDPSHILLIDETSTSLCSQYATYRGFHQRVIAVSMYGPKDNRLFTFNNSLTFLYALIDDISQMYPGWILRVYHDSTVREDIICSIECKYLHVDFCNTTSLIGLGNVAEYIPPRMWRFLPAGDLYVDIIASRDLDSPLIQRELDAVHEWLSTNKSWHVMRDHPLHNVPMLAGLWGFRSAFNRTFAKIFLGKLLNRSTVSGYVGRGDQPFLTEHVWSHIQDDLIAHDSHLCRTSYGLKSLPWPTRRPSLNQTGCFVGCIRPCCPPIDFPFGECPLACRPKNHPDWTMC